MKLHSTLMVLALAVSISSCQRNAETSQTASSGPDSTFKVAAESFADLQTLRYQVPGFNELTLQQKQLAYYLYEAGLSGRDIIYDQRGKYNLLIRKTLENIYTSYSGDQTSEDWEKFKNYAGRFWFSNGNHHHYGNEKFIPEFSYEYFTDLVKKSNPAGFPMSASQTTESFLVMLKPLIFDPSFEPKLVDLSPNIDNIAASSNNFYEGVTQKEVEAFYAKFNNSGNVPSWGLNSKVIKENGKISEKVWKIGGMYGAAIEKIVYWLEKAVTVAENDKQKDALQKLVNYYKSGNLKDFDDYNIAWVADTASRIDATNGFIEVYNDAIGKKGSFESVVSMKDMEATKRIKAIADKAQWFEDNSPLMPEHKKKQVKGITAKAITVIAEAGDASPATPIGINLPNSEWIRKDYGSKSVSLSNIVYSYNVMSTKSGMLDEFAYGDSVKNRARQFGALGSDLHTDMHECIGHASGQLNPGVQTTDKTLKNYASCLEEARADLVALYYIMDPKLVEIGVMPSLEVGKTEYDSYIRNGLLTQLTRLKPGSNLEEAHMRNRQLNAIWAYEKGKKEKVIEFIKVDGKTYTKINDYNKLRQLFGQLLREIQRIKSEGDYNAGKNLVENYGVKVDQTLLKEVLERYAKLNIKPYSGFIQPRLVPVMNDKEITDVKIEYPASFFDQMIEYGKEYSFLPVSN
ncbi:MAG TPA: dihydrofolate reductase [Sphingobacteriaceae bacterium]|nr:dihydrofolate reductase [Sphingobacteriaceae bacterium]